MQPELLASHSYKLIIYSVAICEFFLRRVLVKYFDKIGLTVLRIQEYHWPLQAETIVA